MKIVTGVDLFPLNTLRVQAKAEKFLCLTDESQLTDLRDTLKDEKDVFILGSGSNTLFSGNISKPVVKIELMGREILSEDSDSVLVRFGAGEDWHEMVMWAVGQGYSGVENLAYIPGTLGAAPVQNIAAYGQVFEDVMESVEVFDLDSGEKRVMNQDECHFSYRYSIFKEPEMKRLIVISVTVRLSKIPQYDTSYHSRYRNESLTEWLEKVAKPPYSPKDVATAVTELRKYKLPNVAEVGTCGSFFINPIIAKEKYLELAEKVADLQQYPVTKMDYSRKNWSQFEEDTFVKIPAGRLLDELGWKGKWIGNVGTHDKHALCVITHGEATGDEVVRYVEEMRESVLNAYGLELKSEVVVV